MTPPTKAQTGHRPDLSDDEQILRDIVALSENAFPSVCDLAKSVLASIEACKVCFGSPVTISTCILTSSNQRFESSGIDCAPLCRHLTKVLCDVLNNRDYRNENALDISEALECLTMLVSLCFDPINDLISMQCNAEDPGLRRAKGYPNPLRMPEAQENR